MKYWLTLAVLMCLCCTASHAEGTSVYQVMNDSITVNDVAVSSFTSAGATLQIFTAALTGAATGFPTLMENRKVLEIQNIDNTSDAFCRVDLSSTSANGDLSLATPATLSTTAGRLIGPRGSWVLGLPSRNNSGRVFVPWCVNNSGTGTIKLTVTQGRSL